MRKVFEDSDLADKLLWGLTGREDCTLTQLCIVMNSPASIMVTLAASHQGLQTP